MGEIVCKRCHGTDYVKRGTVRNLQRYRMQDLRLQFHEHAATRQAAAMKALALMLYAMGNMELSAASPAFSGSVMSRFSSGFGNEARRLPEPAVTAETVIITLDEMWHFLKKRLASSGFGARMILSARRTLAWLLGRRDDATCQQLLDKVRLKGKTFLTDDWKGFTVSSPKTSSSPAKT